MAKITIAGSSYVVTSKVSLSDWELVRKHRPKALKIVDEESKEELFAVGIGGNSINEYGVSFGGVSNNERKLATITMGIPTDVEDAAAYVADRIGAAMINLCRVEDGIAQTLVEIAAERKQVTDNITVVV